MSGISWRGGVAGRAGDRAGAPHVQSQRYSFYHWISAPPAGVTALKAFAGVALLIGW
jgi:hypothetical protein